MSIEPFFRSRLSLDRTEIRVVGMFLLVAVLLFAFGKLMSEIMQGDLGGFDRTVLLAFRHPDDPAQPYGPVWLQLAARDITSLGSPAVLTLVTISSLGFLLLTYRWSSSAFLLIGVCGGAALSTLLKDWVQRARPPFTAEVAQLHTYSFPSGHAFLSAVTYLTVGVLLARVQSRPVVRVYILFVAVALTVLVGLTRLYLAVHWPTDVLAGWCAGAAWALLCWMAAEAVQAERGRPESVRAVD